MGSDEEGHESLFVGRAPHTALRSRIRKHVWAAVAVVLGALGPAVAADELSWIELPHLKSFPTSAQLKTALESIYMDAQPDHSMLVIAGNSVFGNVCASSDVGGATGVGLVGGAQGATGVGGAQGATGVGGGVGRGLIDGAQGATGVGGASGVNTIVGASASTSVAGASEATGVAGTAVVPEIAGASGVTAVAGIAARMKCARTADGLDYVLSAPTRTKLLEYDGHELYEVATSKIVSDEKLE